MTTLKEAIDRQHKAELMLHYEELERRLCEQSLVQFVRSTFHLLEPGRKYLHNWHIDAVCEHLEAVNNQQIRDLVINFPYRGMKSLMCSVAWPVWTWIRHPEPGKWLGPQTRFLTLSYASALALRDSVKSRFLINEPWFQDRWGDRIKFKADQNEKSFYENAWLGYRLAMGFDSSATGRDGDIRVIDDPHDAMVAMYSDVERSKAIEAWNQKLANRKTDLSKSATVIVMQRLHPRDLSGHFLELEPNATHLMLPLEYDPKRSKVTALGFKDPRKEPGENLWPERYPAEVVTAEKKRLGTSGFKAQAQQEPVPMGGTIVNMRWFEDAGRYGTSPLAMIKARKFKRIIQFWDTAQKEKELNDPWVGNTWAEDHSGHFYLLDVVRERMDYPTGKLRVRNYWEKWKPLGATACVIEDKSTGSSLLQELPKGKKAVPVIAMLPEQDKVTRMAVESPVIEAGLVHIPESAEWLFDWEAEVSLFPASETKDQVDCFSMALRYFREQPTEAIRAFMAGSMERENPYGGFGATG